MTILNIRLTPNAKRTQVEGLWNNTHWKIAVQAPAVDGKANEALIDFLSRELRVPKREITLLSGEKNRLKRVEIKSSVDLPWPKNTVS